MRRDPYDRSYNDDLTYRTRRAAAYDTEYATGDPNYRRGVYLGERMRAGEGQAAYGRYRLRHADDLGGYGGFRGFPEYPYPRRGYDRALRPAPGERGGYDREFRRPGPLRPW